MKLFAAMALAVAASGCANLTSGEAPRSSDPFLASVEAGSDALAERLLNYQVTVPVIVASTQNNDELSQVCQQGRLIPEIISSRLTNKGVPVKEIRLAKELRISAEGERLLTRDLDDMKKSSPAQVVVTSTWSTIRKGPIQAFGSAQQGQTYVTIKAVRLADGQVLSSQTFVPSGAWSCRR